MITTSIGLRLFDHQTRLEILGSQVVCPFGGGPDIRSNKHMTFPPDRGRSPAFKVFSRFVAPWLSCMNRGRSEPCALSCGEVSRLSNSLE
jgi:hypothetical protein